MNVFRFVRNPYIPFAFNVTYALGNGVIGFLTHSWWFITVGAYHAVLAVARFSVMQIKRKAKGDHEVERFARRMTGVLLVVLSFCIVGMTILSAVKDRGTTFHEIVMITIAAYTFTKITLAIVGVVKAGRCASPTRKTLRNISLADACVSIYTLQRSMLVSFEGMDATGVVWLNLCTGIAVWIVVLLLGIYLLGGKYTDMAKANIAKANRKIAEVVTGGYKKIENGVVSGYKKIENGVVKGYMKIEDRFVDAYLTKDGETVEEAKERLKRKK